MALIGNRSVLLKSPGRFLSGTVASIERSNFSRAGQIANRFQAMSKVFAGIPSGHLAPSSWALPRTAGAMSAINSATFSAAASGLAYGGVTTTAGASFSVSFASAAGQLISSGSGSATLTFSVADALLTASLGGVGTASFSFTTNTPTLGAEASMTASAGMVFSGSLTPYALGHLAGTTVDASVLTVDAIAAGVLAAALTAPIAADIRRVNSYAVDGDGQPGSEWGPV